MGKRRLVLGLGQSGSDIAIRYFRQIESYYKDEIVAVTINTSENDVVNRQNDIHYLMYGHEGTGRDPNKGYDLAKSNMSNILDELWKLKIDIEPPQDEEPTPTRVDVFAGLGGGTGAGFLKALLEILSKQKHLSVNVYAVLPFKNEGNPALPNALVLLKNIIDKYIVPQKITFVPLDNYSYSEVKNIDTINASLAEYSAYYTNGKIYLQDKKFGKYLSLDINDFERIFSSGKGSGIFTVFDIKENREGLLLESRFEYQIPLDSNKIKKALVVINLADYDINKTSEFFKNIPFLETKYAIKSNGKVGELFANGVDFSDYSIFEDKFEQVITNIDKQTRKEREMKSQTSGIKGNILKKM